MISTAIVAGIVVGALLVLVLCVAWLTVRYIPNDRIGIVEKLWSGSGSLKEGAVIALNEEAGYQSWTATTSRMRGSSSPPAGKKAVSGASSGKACTPSTSRCST